MKERAFHNSAVYDKLTLVTGSMYTRESLYLRFRQFIDSVLLKDLL